MLNPKKKVNFVCTAHPHSVKTIKKGLNGGPQGITGDEKLAAKTKLPKSESEATGSVGFTRTAKMNVTLF